MQSPSSSGLVAVKEGKTSDQVLVGGNVVTEQFENGKHGKTSMLEFLELTLLKNLSGKVGLTNFEVTKNTFSIHSSNNGKHLGPAYRRETLEGGKTVGDIGEGSSVQIDITGPAVELRDNVSENSKHGDTPVLEFDFSPTSERLGGGALGEAERVEETSWGDHTDLIRVRRVLEGSGVRLVGNGGESGSGGNERGKDSGLHGGYFTLMMFCSLIAAVADSCGDLGVGRSSRYAFASVQPREPNFLRGR